MSPPESRPSRFQNWFLRLNSRQTRVLVLGIVLFVAAGLFPYWDISHKNEAGKSMRLRGEFHFIDYVPPAAPDEVVHLEAHVNLPWLLVVESVVAAAAIALIRSLRDKNNEAGATFGQYR